jgi:AbrB family looped-hinge helix DNA binding protein
MKISEKGQITIPKTLRDKFGLKKDVEVDFKPVKNGVLISKRSLNVHPVDQVLGILDRESSTDKYMDEIRGK